VKPLAVCTGVCSSLPVGDSTKPGLWTVDCRLWTRLWTQ